LTISHTDDTLKVMEKRFLLREYGKQLWTREKAREIRPQLQGMLQGLNAGETLVIDVKGVEVFDYSFANEFFAKTLLSLPVDYPGSFLVVENLSTYTRENLEKTLESVGLVMIERKGKTLYLLGKLHPADQMTFDAIVRAKEPITAAELSSQLDVHLTAMNERLTKLTKLGLVRREKGTSPAGREQYLYAVLA
jgi:hypothetical protein